MKTRIKYVGPTQHTREISVAQAEAVGIVLAEDMEWSPKNRHTVLVDDLDPSALEYFEGDEAFEVSEIKNAEAKELENKIAAGDPLDGDEIADDELEAQLPNESVNAPATAGARTGRKTSGSTAASQ